MRLTPVVKQIVNNQTIEALRNSISKAISEATPHIQAAKENQVRILSKKLSQLNSWYIRVTGLDKVYLAQEKVNDLQNQLLLIQKKRREVGRQLNDVRQKSMELQDEIHKVKRQDDFETFLDLMKKETEVLKLEKSIMKTFQDYDQTERELFTAFTDSIRDSHEKQRSQMEYTKYFGLVLSITGSFLAFLYSTLRKEQLKRIIDERLETINLPKNEVFVPTLLDSNNKIMDAILKNKQALNEIAYVVNSNFEKLEAKNPGSNTLQSVNSLPDNKYSYSYSTDSFDMFNGKYIKIFGVVLGVLFLSKILTG